MGEKTNGDRENMKRPLGRPRNRCSIEIDLKERMGWSGMDFSGSE